MLDTHYNFNPVAKGQMHVSYSYCPSFFSANFGIFICVEAHLKWMKLHIQFYSVKLHIQYSNHHMKNMMVKDFFQTIYPLI